MMRPPDCVLVESIWKTPGPLSRPIVQARCPGPLSRSAMVTRSLSLGRATMLYGEVRSGMSQKVVAGNGAGARCSSSAMGVGDAVHVCKKVASRVRTVNDFILEGSGMILAEIEGR